MSDVVEAPKMTLKNLSVLAYANQFTHWHYRGLPSEALLPSFFSDGSGMFALGDMITVSDSGAGINIFVVRKDGAGVVVEAA